MRAFIRAACVRALDGMTAMHNLKTALKTFSKPGAVRSDLFGVVLQIVPAFIFLLLNESELSAKC